MRLACLTAMARGMRIHPLVPAVLAVVVVGVLYLGVVATSILVLGPGVGGSQAPLAELLGVAFGAPGLT